VRTESEETFSRRLAVLLFLSFQFLYLFVSTGRVRTMDEVTLAFEVESLAKHGSTAIPKAVEANLFFGKKDRFGQPQAPYGPGNALAVVPWYWAGQLALATLPGIPHTASDLVSDAFLTASNATFSAISVSFAFLLFLYKGCTCRVATIAAVFTGLATPLFSYSGWFFSEPLAVALLLAAACLLFSRPPKESIHLTHAIVAGICLGWLMWVRPTNVVIVPVFLLAVLLRSGFSKNWKPAMTVAALVGLFGAAYLLRNLYLFQNPLDFGYPTETEGVQRLTSFETPLLSGLRIFLFSPGKSIFLFAPPVLLAIPGLSRLARLDRGLALIASGCPLVYLLLFARYTFLEGAYSYGPRYLVPAISLLCLGLGPFLAHSSPWSRRAFFFLALLGLSIQALGISTNDLEIMVKGPYYDSHWRYRPDFNPIPAMVHQLIRYWKSTSPAPLGLGFDRWFVFLAKARVARGLIFSGLLFEFGGLIFFSWRLRSALSGAPAGGSAGSATQ